MQSKVKTLFIGQSRIHLPEVDSTNLFAQNIVSKSNPPEGTVITTDFQLSGRGQIGRNWYSSPSKNMMSSTILYPKWLLARDQFKLNMAISCAVRAFISEEINDADVTIKWPNDIYIGHKKIAGLLIQNTLGGAYINSTIIGIGININESAYPPELPNPTSFYLHNGKSYDLQLLYVKLYEALEKYYLQLKSGNTEQMMAEYIYNLYGKDRPMVYTNEKNQEIIGIVQHVDSLGKLVMLIDGKEETFSFREIRLKID